MLGNRGLQVVESPKKGVRAEMATEALFCSFCGAENKDIKMVTGGAVTICINCITKFKAMLEDRECRPQEVIVICSFCQRTPFEPNFIIQKRKGVSICKSCASQAKQLITNGTK